MSFDVSTMDDFIITVENFGTGKHVVSWTTGDFPMYMLFSLQKRHIFETRRMVLLK
jgi:hypothetical protein